MPNPLYRPCSTENKNIRSFFLDRLNNIPLSRFTGTIFKRFCFFGCYTKIFVLKGKEQGVDQSGDSYQLVVSNSYSCLYTAVLSVYTPAYSRDCGLVQFSILVCSLVCRTKRSGAYHKCFVVGLFVQYFHFYFDFLTLGANTSSWQGSSGAKLPPTGGSSRCTSVAWETITQMYYNKS